jgi:arsenate reductase
MAEVGIDIAGQRPKILTTDTVRAAEVVITMGCGDSCPIPRQTRPLSPRWNARAHATLGAQVHPRTCQRQRIVRSAALE